MIRLSQLFRFPDSYEKVTDTAGNCFPRRIHGLKIRIYGKNNRIFVESCGPETFRKCEIQIHGDDCIIRIARVAYMNSTKIIFMGDRQVLTIGSHSTFESSFFMLCTDDSELHIGQDTMWATGTEVRTGDGHAVCDEVGNLLNNERYILSIGDHVWVGRDVLLLKRASIAEGTVIAARSVVTKCFNEKGIVIAGNPACKISENITWRRELPKRKL